MNDLPVLMYPVYFSFPQKTPNSTLHPLKVKQTPKMENAPLVATEKESNQLNLVSIPPPVVPTMKPGEPSLSAKLLSAGLAACFADMITFPLDTAKVRLQVGMLPRWKKRASVGCD